MLDRRFALAVLTGGMLAVAGPATASNGTAFTQAAFEAAQNAGKSILVIVHAPWCPTCRVQDPILRKLLAEQKYKGVVTFVVDFDSQKDVLRRLNASKQSTLIGFKGKSETKRSTGDVETMTIEDLLETTL